MTDDILDILASSRLFDGVAIPALDALARRARRLRLKRHALLWSAGSTLEALPVVAAGRLKVGLAEHGGREVVVAIAGPGEALGETALIDARPLATHVTALAPTALILLPVPNLRRALGDDARLARNLLDLMAQRLREAQQNAADLALLDVRDRLARTLTRLAEPCGGEQVITARLTHQDIAHIVGASRERVSRLFKALADSGAIRVERGRIVLRAHAPSNA
ncbi:MAG TPA: Crp/Fnr family transcriptional regulator [Acidiferrobacterales bacterium]